MPISQSPVLVTGATGFVAAELVKQLLAAGYRVRGTTRNVEKAVEQGELTSLPGASERLELVAADLNEPGAFTPHMTDVEYVLHTASPYILQVDDPQRDLVDPAVNGTMSVLHSAAETPSVKRIVLTSSFAAVSNGGRDEPYSEADWNEESSLTNGPYAYSKTMAERSAWDFMEEENRHFDLVVINPVGVIGPSVVNRVNQTHEFMIGMTNGQAPAIIDMSFPIVDVRDVAKAHILAMETPEAHGRYLTSAGAPPFRRYIDVMNDAGLDEHYELPKLGLDNPVGSLVVKGLMLTQPKGVREAVSPNLGAKFDLNTSKIENELGMDWMDIDTSIHDQAMDLHEKGYLGKQPD